MRQPWAWAIIHGGKDVENRVRSVAGDYRGQVAIHAAIGKTAEITETDEHLLLAQDRTGLIAQWLDGEPIEGGVIIGLIDLVDVHHWSECLGGVFGCSPWAQSDSHHLMLANPRPVEPIPFKGALGLRKLNDAAVLAKLQEDL